jgi:hypothetical protein
VTRDKLSGGLRRRHAIPAVRRLGRRLLHVLTVVSLLLCVASVALWVQSDRAPVMYERTQCWPAEARSEVFQCYSGAGGFELVWSWQVSIDPPQSMREALDQPVESRWMPRQQFSGPPLPGTPWWMRLGFDWRDFRDEIRTQSNDRIPFVIRDHMLMAGAPYWAVMLVAAALPLWAAGRWGRRRRRARRLRRGLCPSCGYDLTGNVSGACPECGWAPLAGATVSPSFVARRTWP